MDDDQRVGLTPIVMRAAIGYMNRGVGVYGTDLFGCDKVEVRTSRKWGKAPIPGPTHVVYSQETQVSFFRAGRRVRWVDFVTRVSGAGGEPALSEITVLGEEE